MHLHPWIWQSPQWPTFTWRAETMAPLLRACAKAQGQLLGLAASSDADSTGHEALDALLQNILTTSAIEGETLNVGSVRSSLARRLGLKDSAPVTPRSESMAELMFQATRQPELQLTLSRLVHWHTLLFPVDDSLATQSIQVGKLRGSEPMQVVSGRLDRPTVHFEAPPREGLDQQLEKFLLWFSQSRDDATLDPLLRAGIAHFWFVTLHPFDDGNGRLTRAITDLALTQADPQAIRFYTMSASILADRKGYYQILESSQKSTVEISAWLEWFLRTLLDSLEQALWRIHRLLAKTRFWQQHRGDELSTEQVKVLNRLLDGGPKGFADGISASQYQAVAKVSKATASRHLADLLKKGCLHRLPAGGRSTRYVLAPA